MLLLINEWQDSKVHIFEVELLVYTGGAQYNLFRSRECNSLEEVLEFINEIYINNEPHHHYLTLNYNNEKYSYVKNQTELITLINRCALLVKKPSNTN